MSNRYESGSPVTCSGEEVTCMIGLCRLGRQIPKATKIAAGVLYVLYGIAVFGGAARLVWMVMF